jgi:hypothetical protein
MNQKTIICMILYMNRNNPGDSQLIIIQAGLSPMSPSFSPFFFPPTTRRPTGYPFYHPTSFPSFNPSSSFPSTNNPSGIPSYYSIQYSSIETYVPSSVPSTNPMILNMSPMFSKIIYPSMTPSMTPMILIYSTSVSSVSNMIQYLIISIVVFILILLTVIFIKCFILKYTEINNDDTFSNNRTLEDKKSFHIDIDLSDIIDSLQLSSLKTPPKGGVMSGEVDYDFASNMRNGVQQNNNLDIHYERISPSKIRLLIDTEKRNSQPIVFHNYKINYPYNLRPNRHETHLKNTIVPLDLTSFPGDNSHSVSSFSPIHIQSPRPFSPRILSPRSPILNNSLRTIQHIGSPRLFEEAKVDIERLNMDWLTEEDSKEEEKHSNTNDRTSLLRPNKETSGIERTNESFHDNKDGNSSVLNKLFLSVSKKSNSSKGYNHSSQCIEPSPSRPKEDPIKDPSSFYLQQQQLNYFIPPQTHQLLSPPHNKFYSGGPGAFPGDRGHQD